MSRSLLWGVWSPVIWSRLAALQSHPVPPGLRSGPQPPTPVLRHRGHVTAPGTVNAA